MSKYQVEHQAEESLFYVALEDGQRAFVKYRRSGIESAKAMVDFYSTFVPEAYRGKSLAAELIDCAFSWAEENELHINTSCWYAAKKLERRYAKRDTAES